jgi:hypothetical protein
MLLLALLRTVHADLMPVMVENHQSEAHIVVFPRAGFEGTSAHEVHAI